MYSFKSRIRYSEVGNDGRLTLLGLLNYFQDCAIFHSEDLGVGVEYLDKLRGVWVMNFWQIDVDGYPCLGEQMTIETHPYDFKLCMGFRNFGMRTQEGQRVAAANTLWTFLNVDTGRPMKPSQEMMDKYEIEPPDEMEYLDRKIVFEGQGESAEPVEVKGYHLDTNNHVNNAQYVRVACDYLPADFQIRRMRATYHKSAVLGDFFYPIIYKEKEGVVGVALCDAENQPYANVEFCDRR